jgi:uncharacterized protein (TIGR02301 family)
MRAGRESAAFARHVTPMRPILPAVLIALALALPQPAPAADVRPTALLEDLKRLADSLGALHYLRGLCGRPEGQAWRDEMQALVDAEGADKAWRDQLTGSFNRGFRAYQDLHRTCTPTAEALIRRHAAEGLSLSRDIGLRFGE